MYSDIKSPWNYVSSLWYSSHRQPYGTYLNLLLACHVLHLTNPQNKQIISCAPFPAILRTLWIVVFLSHPALSYRIASRCRTPPNGDIFSFQIHASGVIFPRGENVCVRHGHTRHSSSLTVINTFPLMYREKWEFMYIDVQPYYRT